MIKTEINDKDIVVLCQAGDFEQFGILYDKYVKRIYEFICFRTSHKETAEDLTSKTFMKALEGIKSFNADKGSFSSWLYTIARNSVIDHYRVSKNVSDLSQAFDLASSDDLESDQDIKNKLEEVKAYLEKLKPEQREIIMMRVWEGLSYKEIAEIIGKSEDNCKVIFSRAINLLRKDLQVIVLLLLIRAL